MSRKFIEARSLYTWYCEVCGAPTENCWDDPSRCKHCGWSRWD